MYAQQGRRCKFCDTLLIRSGVVVTKNQGVFVLSCGGCQELNEGDFENQEFVSLRKENHVSFFKVQAAKLRITH